jgi:hypothetical protein
MGRSFWGKTAYMHCPYFDGKVILGKSRPSALPENRRRGHFGEKQTLCFARKSLAKAFWVKATPLLCPKIGGGFILGKSRPSALPENRRRSHFGEKQHLCFARKSLAESFWVKATPLLCPKIVGGVILGKSKRSALPENRRRRHFG